MARRKQDTLVLFPDVYMSAEKLTDAQFGALMRAAFSYRFEDLPYTGDDIMVELLFNVLKTQLDRYKDVCEQNRANVQKRYAQTLEEEELPNATESYEGLRNATESYENLRKPTHTHNHNHNHSHSHTHNHNHNQDHNHTHNPQVDKNGNPTVAAIDAYCEEQGFTHVSPVDFWSYYFQRGWEDDNGKPIENWKALLHTWNEQKKIEKYDF